jgi:hypothetical protein
VEIKIHTGGRAFKTMSSTYSIIFKINYSNAHKFLNLGGLAYSPELNRIEILWKQAKYFWRKFVYLTKDSLLQEVRSIMENYRKAFTINFG